MLTLRNLGRAVEMSFSMSMQCQFPNISKDQRQHRRFIPVLDDCGVAMNPLDLSSESQNMALVFIHSVGKVIWLCLKF